MSNWEFPVPEGGSGWSTNLQTSLDHDVWINAVMICGKIFHVDPPVVWEKGKPIPITLGFKAGGS